MAGLGRILALVGVAVAAVALGPVDVSERHYRETAGDLVGVATSYPVLASMFVVANAVVLLVPLLLVFDTH